MEEIDQLLAKIKQEYQQKSSNSNQFSNPSLSSKINSNSKDELNNLLGAFMNDFTKNKSDMKYKEQDSFKGVEPDSSQEQNISNKHEGRLNDTLEQLQSKFTQPKKNKNNQVNSELKDNHLDDFFTEIKHQFVAEKKSPQSSKILAESQLEEIENQYKQKNTQTKVTQELNIETIRRQELDKQREGKALVRQAEEWLNKLDPYSDEGFWFQQFAESYSSRLEAAIDYLKTLNGSK